MRPLFISDVERKAAQAVVDYAAQPKHWYRPHEGVVPGTDPAHQIVLWTYRCVFSYSVIDGEVLRHLSISVPSVHLPNPGGVLVLAELFGFTGGKLEGLQFPHDWQVVISHNENCIVVLQPLSPQPGLEGTEYTSGDVANSPWRVIYLDRFERVEQAAGNFDDEATALHLAHNKLIALEEQQPTATSGGQAMHGIQDRVFIQRPNGSRYRVLPPKEKR